MIARQEYPRPQFIRNDWLSLNGEWDFAFDDQHQGLKQKWYQGGAFPLKITVPFVYQSRLSGIGDVSFHDWVWYRKNFRPSNEVKDKRVILHFGAVDYDSRIWVNGQLACMHQGGQSSFSVDITDLIYPGDNEICVLTQDYFEDLTLPRGKQYWKEKGEVMWFTNMTGIWQPVWLEFVNDVHLQRVRYTPHLDTNEIEMQMFMQGWDPEQKMQLNTQISFAGKTIATDCLAINESVESRRINLRDFNDHGLGRWWSPEKPNLYDVEFTLTVDGKVVDTVKSYFGMRKISVENGKLFLNNKPYCMKLVLDQGYYPDSLLTPPTDDSIHNDVELCKAMGFNGMRKHMMVADPRYLYWCDKLGVLVWGEMAGAYVYSEEYAYRMTKEWMEVIERDYNHPCIVVWVPLNESWGVPDINFNEKQQHHAQTLYHLTKSVDSTRLVISNDGWEHCQSDLCTIHDYEKSSGKLQERYTSIDNVLTDLPGGKFIYVPGFEYRSEPVLVSEFGAINYHCNKAAPVVYPKAENDHEFIQRLVDVINPLLTSKLVQGYCYTQLTDTETEICGLLTWDRQPKVSLEIIRRINEGESDLTKLV